MMFFYINYSVSLLLTENSVRDNIGLTKLIKLFELVKAYNRARDEAPGGYKDFDSGVAKKFVIDPHGMLK